MWTMVGGSISVIMCGLPSFNPKNFYRRKLATKTRVRQATLTSYLGLLLRGMRLVIFAHLATVVIGQSSPWLGARMT